MRKLFCIVALFAFVGCASLAGPKDEFFGGKVFQTAVDEGCDLACREQVAMDEKVCGNVCNTLADIGVEYAEENDLAGMTDDQKLDVFGAAFERAVDTVCGTICFGQSGVDPSVCDLTCNFLAKTGVDVLKSKLK